MIDTLRSVTEALPYDAVGIEEFDLPLTLSSSASNSNEFLLSDRRQDVGDVAPALDEKAALLDKSPRESELRATLRAQAGRMGLVGHAARAIGHPSFTRLTEPQQIGYNTRP